MKAVAYQRSLPVEEAESLLDVELPDPVVQGRDLLIEVRAVSVNPVDTKMRMRSEPVQGQWQVLGWDASGVVRAVGDEVRGFRPGDRVWYAGAIDRPGSNAELQLVDERLVGSMPDALDFAAAPVKLVDAQPVEPSGDGVPVGPGSTVGFDQFVATIRYTERVGVE